MAEDRSMAMEVVITARDKASRAIRNLRRNIQGVAGSIGTRLVNAIRGAVRWLMRMATWAGIAGAAMVEEFSRRSVNAFADYEQSITSAASATGFTGEKFEEAKQQLHDFGLELAQTSKKTAPDISQAFKALMLSGLDVQEAMKSSTAAVALAEGTGSDLHQTTELLTSSWRAFSGEIEDFIPMANTLAATSTESRATLERLGTALPFVAADAANLGVSFERTNAALGVLMDRGVRASMAGTRLRAVLARVNKFTAEGTKVLQRHGLRTRDLAVQQWGLVEVLERINDAQFSYNEMLTLFGRRGAGAALILSKNVHQMENMAAAVTGTNRAFLLQQQQMDTLQSQWEAFKGDIIKLKIEFAQAFAPVLREVVAGMRGFVQWLSESGVVKRFGEALGTGLKGVMEFLSEIVSRGDLEGFFRRLADDVATFAQDLRRLLSGETVKQWIAAFKANFIQAFVAAFKTAVKWADRVITNWFRETFGREWVEKYWKPFKKAIVKIWKAIAKIIGEQGDNIIAIINKLVPVFVSLVQAIANTIRWLADLHPALGAAGLAILLFGDPLGWIGSLLWGLGSALVGVIIEAGGVQAAVVAAGSAISGFGTTLAGLAAAGGPIALVVAFLAAMSWSLYRTINMARDAAAAYEDMAKSTDQAVAAGERLARQTGALVEHRNQLAAVRREVAKAGEVGARGKYAATMGETLLGWVTGGGVTGRTLAKERIRAKSYANMPAPNVAQRRAATQAPPNVNVYIGDKEVRKISEEVTRREIKYNFEAM